MAIKVDTKAFDFSKITEYTHPKDEEKAKYLYNFAEAFTEIEEYFIDSNNGPLNIIPHLAIPEGFVVAAGTTNRISKRKKTITFCQKEGTGVVRVLFEQTNSDCIPSEELGIKTLFENLYFYTNIKFNITIFDSENSYNLAALVIEKEITAEKITAALRKQQCEILKEREEKSGITELVDVYFSAEETKKKSSDKLREYAEEFIKVESWAIKFKDNIFRICPVICIPKGYETKDSIIIEEVSKAQDIYLTKADEEGNVIEKIKLVVNISGTESINSEGLDLNLGKGRVIENLYFCNSMRFKVVFYGADGQKLRHEFRTVVTKEDMTKVLKETFSANI